jgi:hypothetical protein
VSIVGPPEARPADGPTVDFVVESKRLYVFVILDIGTCRVVYWNLIDHPTAEVEAHDFCASPWDAQKPVSTHARSVAAAVTGCLVRTAA